MNGDSPSAALPAGSRRVSLPAEGMRLERRKSVVDLGAEMAKGASSPLARKSLGGEGLNVSSPAQASKKRERPPQKLVEITRVQTQFTLFPQDQELEDDLNFETFVDTILQEKIEWPDPAIRKSRKQKKKEEKEKEMEEQLQLEALSHNTSQMWQKLPKGGFLRVWGTGMDGQLGLGEMVKHVSHPTLVADLVPKTVSSLQDVLGQGETFTVALTDVGDLYVWGEGEKGQLGLGKKEKIALMPTQVPALQGKHVYRVGCGPGHTLAVVACGTTIDEIYAWGESTYGKLGIGEKAATGDPFWEPVKIDTIARTKVLGVDCGNDHTIILAASPNGNNHVYTFGRNVFGQLGHSDTHNRYQPTLVQALVPLKIVRVASGASHCAVLRDNGSVYTWGNGEDGRLGHGDFSNQTTPTEITSLQKKRIVRISAGSAHNLCVTARGACWSWGSNDYGQLGLGHTKCSAVPKKIDFFTKEVMAISAGAWHSAAICEGDILYTWGHGESGQLAHDPGGLVSNESVPRCVETMMGFGVSQAICGKTLTFAVLANNDRRWPNYPLDKLVKESEGERNEYIHQLRVIEEEKRMKLREYLRAKGNDVAKKRAQVAHQQKKDKENHDKKMAKRRERLLRQKEKNEAELDQLEIDTRKLTRALRKVLPSIRENDPFRGVVRGTMSSLKSYCEPKEAEPPQFKRSKRKKSKFNPGKLFKDNMERMTTACTNLDPSIVSMCSSSYLFPPHVSPRRHLFYGSQDAESLLQDMREQEKMFLEEGKVPVPPKTAQTRDSSVSRKKKGSVTERIPRNDFRNSKTAGGMTASTVDDAYPYEKGPLFYNHFPTPTSNERDAFFPTPPTSSGWTSRPLTTRPGSMVTRGGMKSHL